MLNRYLDISTEVKEALEQGKPVVALESTIISHGMPYPQNVETAMNAVSYTHLDVYKRQSYHSTTPGPRGTLGFLRPSVS